MSVTYASGFRAAGVVAGLKSSGAPDVAVVINDSTMGRGRSVHQVIACRPPRCCGHARCSPTARCARWS